MQPVQSYSNPTTTYFLSNPAKKDLNMNGYNINNANLINANVSANNITVNTLTSDNIFSINIESTNSQVNNLVSNFLYVSSGSVLQPTLTINGGVAPTASLSLDNGAGGAFTFFSVGATGGGLQAGDLQLFHYTNGVPDNQPLIVTSTGNLIMPTTGTVFSSPTVITSGLTGGANGLTLTLPVSKKGTTPPANGSSEVSVFVPSITSTSMVFLSVANPVGATAGGAYVSNIVANSGFAFKGIDSTDLSTYRYIIIEQG